MRKFLKKSLIVYLSILLFATACSNSSSTSTNTSSEGDNKNIGEPAKDNNISIGVTGSMGTLNPIDRRDNVSRAVVDILFNPLVELDEDTMEFVPMLAESVETQDNQTYTAKLNPNAKWTDGKPVTADDVLFTIEMLTHPKVTSIFKINFNYLEGTDKAGNISAESIEQFPGAVKIDDHTIEFKTKKPVDTTTFHDKILYILRAMPKHILSDIDPEKFDQHPFMQAPTVSYGAFKWGEHMKNQYVMLEANNEYYKGAPKVDKLFLKFVTPANLVVELEKGVIDMNFPPAGSIDTHDIDRLKNTENLQIIPGAPLRFTLLGFHHEKISDRKLRQAMAYAINKNAIVNGVLQGHGEAMYGPYGPRHPNYNGDIVESFYPYDPEKAKQLLNEIGWDNKQTFELAIPSDNKIQKAAEIITENLRTVGINVQIQESDAPTTLQRMINGEFDLFMWTSNFYISPDKLRNLTPGSSSNYSRYDNPEMTEILFNGAESVDLEERKKIYDEYQRLHMEDLAEFQLYLEHILRVVNKNVVTGEPKDIGMFINVHEWEKK